MASACKSSLTDQVVVLTVGIWDGHWIMLRVTDGRCILHRCEGT